MPDNDEIVRQQAEQIEALESEIVQLYSELYPKQKHKSKRQPPDGQVEAPEGTYSGWIAPQPLRFIWWFLFWPGRLSEYRPRLLRAVRTSDCWQVSALLTYFPLLFAALSYILGATVVPLSFPVRLVAGLGLVLILLWGWLATAETKSYEKRDRTVSIGLTTGLAFIAITIGLPFALRQTAVSTDSIIGLGFVIAAGTAHAGLAQGVTGALTGRRRKHAGYASGAYVVYTVLVIGLVCAVEAATAEERPPDRTMVFFFLLPTLGFMLSPVAFMLVFGLGQLFSFEMIWGLERYRKEGEYLSRALLRMLGQVVLLGLLLFIYIGALSFGVVGGLFP